MYRCDRNPLRTIERMESEEGRLLRWPGVLQGALVGLAGLALVAIVASVVDRTSLADQTVDNIRLVLLLGVLASYGLAGWFAGRRAPRAPFANGTVAAFGALIAWIPLRIAIWAVRSDDHGLISGDDAVFTAGAIYSQVIIATAFGMFGGWLGARRTFAEQASGSSLGDSGESPAAPEGSARD